MKTSSTAFFLLRDDQEMQSPGFKNIKMWLVQVLHFRKVKPQRFRLLSFPLSHHVRHLESGYLIWKGKTLAQLVTCGRMQRGGPGWCVCSPGKGRGALWWALLPWGRERLWHSAAVVLCVWCCGVGAGRGVQGCSCGAGLISGHGTEWAQGIWSHIRGKYFFTVCMVLAKSRAL